MSINISMTARTPGLAQTIADMADVSRAEEKRKGLDFNLAMAFGGEVTGEVVVKGNHPAVGRYMVAFRPSITVPDDSCELVLRDGTRHQLAVTKHFMGGTIATEIERKLPKIIILGHGRHGKDTVAQYLKELFGFSPMSSSLACAEVVMMPYFAGIGRPYASVEECYADRHTGDNRSVWFQQISAFNSPDRTRLIRSIFDDGYDVYTGMRNRLEYEEARKLADHVLWVDASGRGVPLEDRSSFDIDYDPDTMIWVDNNGSDDTLWWNVDEIGTRILRQRERI